MKFSSFYRYPLMVVMMLIMMLALQTGGIAAPSRFEVMRTLKWQVIDVLEHNLNSGLLAYDQKAQVEYTIYKMKSSIAQFTNREYFEDLYYQTYQLTRIRAFVDKNEHRQRIDRLLEFYQSVLNEMYTSKDHD